MTRFKGVRLDMTSRWGWREISLISLYNQIHMERTVKEFLLRFTVVLIMLLALGYIIYIGSAIIIPFALSALIAILLMPVCVFLEKRKIPKIISALAAITIATVFIGGILYFLSAQIATFLNDSEGIQKGLNEHLITLQKWIRTTFGLSFKEQSEMIGKLQSVGESGLGSTMSSLSEVLFIITLLPICIFFFFIIANCSNNSSLIFFRAVLKDMWQKSSANQEALFKIICRD